MEKVLLKMLFIASVSAQFGKHVYVKEHYTWVEAQTYCRDHHTDLSPITTPWVEKRLETATATWNMSGRFWIGLYRHGTQWKWSGGGNASNILWDIDVPDNYRQRVASVCWRSCNWTGRNYLDPRPRQTLFWHNTALDHRRTLSWTNKGSRHEQTFFCFNLMVVEDEKTWEEALQYCRSKHRDLTSLASETEQLLALSEIKPNQTTERMWIGLRYLGDRWLWVNGDPLKFKAWSGGAVEDQQCPIQNRCGALTRGGLWENWDCQEKLKFICY